MMSDFIELENGETSENSNGNEMLKQDEVDALLLGLSNSEEGDWLREKVSEEHKESIDRRNSARQKDENELNRYRERLPRLEVINDRFARIATHSLSNLLKFRVELNPISIDVSRFGEVMRSLPVPTWISVIKVNPYNTHFISVMDSRLVFATVENTMGGRGSQPKIEGREFTVIEQTIMLEVEERLISMIDAAYSEIFADIDMVREKSEINPQFACVFDPRTPCVVTHFEVELDTSLGAVILIIPIPPFEEFFPLFKNMASTARVFTVPDKDFVALCQKKRQKRRAILEKLSDFVPRQNYFQSLAKLHPHTFAEVTRNEHPQTLACLFSFFPPEIAAPFLLSLPAGVRAEVIRRMRYLYIHNPYFLDKIDQLFSKLVTISPLCVSDKGSQLLNAVGEIDIAAKVEIEEDLTEDY